MKGSSLGIRRLMDACLWCVILAGLLRPVAASEPARSDGVASAAATTSTATTSSATPSDAAASEASSDTAADQQDGKARDTELEKLRAMLDRSGPDGRTERESAIAQLLAMPRAEAHRLLHDRLRLADDPDSVRISILTALQGHLLGSVTTQFGGADKDLRRELLTGYLGACAPLWANAPVVDDDEAAPVRAAARRALQRVPVRELGSAASTLMHALEPVDRSRVLRCLADMQNTLLAPTIAGQLEAPEAVVRAAAQKALDLLVYPDATIRTKAEFDAWQAEFGTRSYVDLAQRSARLGPRAYQQLIDKMESMRVDAAREFVSVHVGRRAGIDWAAVQERTTSDGPAVLDACLEALQESLARSPVVEGAATPRHAFFRALLDRLKLVPESQQPDVQRRRALLLEVAAYLIRPEEAELAGEIRQLLLAQLAGQSREGQVAALRGLRRFPSDQARQALVERARALFADATANQPQLQVILDTLASRTEPRWLAPGPDAADKSDWVALIDQSCRSAPDRDLRGRGLLLAQTLDGRKQYVPEAFSVLRKLAADDKLDTKFRSTCLIYLDAWRSDGDLADDWLNALQESLDDTEAGLRKQAAKSLVRLRDSNDTRRHTWLPETITRLRSRLLLEQDAGTLDAVVDCMTELGREQGMPERAIGAIKFVLGQLGDPIKKEHEFRIDPLLRALATIAADQRAGSGEWLAACEPLLHNGKRKGLRLVLQTHRAHELAKDVSSTDAATAERARRAMRCVIGAASLLPMRTDWKAEEHKEEARHVRTAFGALDTVDIAQRLDGPQHRMLRLAVDLAAGKNQEVVRRATAWLNEPAPADVVYRDRLRLLAAEAQLALNKPKEALGLLEARSSEAAAEPDALDLSSRIAATLVANEPKRAAAVFERTMRATSTEDPHFRARLLDWMRCSLRDPTTRPAVLAEAEKHAALFAAVDCPAKQRVEFEQLRSQN
jgi:hypothetical protein